MKRLRIITDAASQYADAATGVGVYFEGQIRMIGGARCNACETIRRLSESTLRREIVSRFATIATIDGLHELTLPFGITTTAQSLCSAIDSPAVVFVVSAVNPLLDSKLDLGLLHAQPRKAKKYLTKVIANANPYQIADHQHIVGILQKIVVDVAARHAEWKETAFTNTLASYKDFVSSFCHEALSPIQEIQTTLELALKDDAITGSSHQRLASSHRSLEGLRVSLEGMRLLFRDDHRQPLPNQFREINLRATVDRWLESYQAQFQEKNVVTIAEPNGRPWKLTCVPEYVEILVKNMINNGAKYSFDASCFVDGEAGKFLVRFDQKSRKLSFVNFGVPIPKTEIESGSLFEREIRGGTANDRGRVGKGVGLYLAKRVVDLHNAEVFVRSQIQNPGGTQEFARNEFEIRFPEKAQ
jgi:signal transduction histidine kinase